MADDDLDLDELDLEAEPAAPAPAKPPKRRLFGRGRAGSPKPAPTGADRAAGPADDQQRPAVIPPERQGLGARISRPFAEMAARIKLPPWNARTFGLGLAVLALVLLVVENWPPMRLSFIGLHADVPKAIVLVLDFALGFLAAWWILRRRRTAPPVPTAEPEGPG